MTYAQKNLRKKMFAVGMDCMLSDIAMMLQSEDSGCLDCKKDFDSFIAALVNMLDDGMHDETLEVLREILY